MQLPRLGTIKLKEKDYLPINANVLFATISEKAGRWYVSIQVEEEHAEPRPSTGPAIGVDLGIKTLATLSDGRSIANPKALRSRLKALSVGMTGNTASSAGIDACGESSAGLQETGSETALDEAGTSQGR